MSTYIIQGGKKLEGEVSISGSKNAALPIIAASILNAGKTTLYNVPNIQDTQMMFKILEELGAKGLAWVKVDNESNLNGGISKFIDEERKEKISKEFQDKYILVDELNQFILDNYVDSDASH